MNDTTSPSDRLPLPLIDINEVREYCETNAGVHVAIVGPSRTRALFLWEQLQSLVSGDLKISRANGRESLHWPNGSKVTVWALGQQRRDIIDAIVLGDLDMLSEKEAADLRAASCTGRGVRPAKCPTCGSADRFVVDVPCSWDTRDPDEWHRHDPAPVVAIASHEPVADAKALTTLPAGCLLVSSRPGYGPTYVVTNDLGDGHVLYEVAGTTGTFTAEEIIAEWGPLDLLHRGDAPETRGPTTMARLAALSYIGLRTSNAALEWERAVSRVVAVGAATTDHLTALADLVAAGIQPYQLRLMAQLLASPLAQVPTEVARQPYQGPTADLIMAGHDMSAAPHYPGPGAWCDACPIPEPAEGGVTA